MHVCAGFFASLGRDFDRIVRQATGRVRTHWEWHLKRSNLKAVFSLTSDALGRKKGRCFRGETV